MAKCLMTEIKYMLDISRVSKIKSIFFGGGKKCRDGYYPAFNLLLSVDSGTPSLATPQTIASVIGTVKNNVHLDAHSEITLEANPTSTEENKLKFVLIASLLDVLRLKLPNVLHFFTVNQSVCEFVFFFFFFQGF
jgi:hypothetical protein